MASARFKHETTQQRNLFLKWKGTNLQYIYIFIYMNLDSWSRIFWCWMYCIWVKFGSSSPPVSTSAKASSQAQGSWQQQMGQSLGLQVERPEKTLKFQHLQSQLQIFSYICVKTDMFWYSMCWSFDKINIIRSSYGFPAVFSPAGSCPEPSFAEWWPHRRKRPRTTCRRPHSISSTWRPFGRPQYIGPLGLQNRTVKYKKYYCHARRCLAIADLGLL